MAFDAADGNEDPNVTIKKRKKPKKKDNKKAIIFAALFLVAASIGFKIITSDDVGETPEGKSLITLHYFYLRTCPNCQAVKPYMTYIENKYPEVTFHKYDLKNNEGGIEFSFYSHKLDNPSGGVPFAVLVGDDGREMTSFLGRVEVMELEKAITTKLKLPAPTKNYEVPEIMVEGCKECHVAKNLPMPSTYSCDFCCHSTRF